MEESDNVLFVRGTAQNTTCSEADDVWDDTALIKAYDKAVNLAKDQVAKKIGMEIESADENSDSQNYKKSGHGKKVPKKWNVGALCQAEYWNDGEIYEAIVTSINEKNGTCMVTFVGYGNTETVKLSSLLASKGMKSQIEQQKSVLSQDEDVEDFDQTNADLPSANSRMNGFMGERMDYETEPPRMGKNSPKPGTSFNSSYGIIPPAPPLPPQLMSKLPENDADALSSMLMSWYISGFHTGYYHGIKQARHLEDKRKK